MYYFTKTVDSGIEDAVEHVTSALKNEGFGVLHQIDMKTTLKKKIDVDFRPYVILGACNPPYAYKALTAEDKIGTMLPCNVVVQENFEGKTEITAVDPSASMMAVENDELQAVAAEIRDRLKRVIESL